MLFQIPEEGTKLPRFLKHWLHKLYHGALGLAGAGKTSGFQMLIKQLFVKKSKIWENNASSDSSLLPLGLSGFGTIWISCLCGLCCFPVIHCLEALESICIESRGIVHLRGSGLEGDMSTCGNWLNWWVTIEVCGSGESLMLNNNGSIKKIYINNMLL